MSYNEQTLAQVSVVCTTPNGTDGGIWMSGRAPVVDSTGSVYFMTGNGDYDGASDFGDSFVKYSGVSNALSLSDWFTPDDFSTLASTDQDLGASGPLLIPGTSLLVGGGKEGILYVVNTSNMGHEWAGNSQIVQWFDLGAGGIFSGPVFYNRTSNLGPWLYIWANNGFLDAYHFNGNTLDLAPISQSIVKGTTTYGSGLAVTANGSTPGTGIVWASQNVSAGSFGQGTALGELHAFSADNLANELWNSNMNSARDGIGTWAKWRSPLEANGKLYTASFTTSTTTSASLSVYGLLSSVVASSMSSKASFIATTRSRKEIGKGFTEVTAITWRSPPKTSLPMQPLRYSGIIATRGPRTRRMFVRCRCRAGGRIAACWYGTSSFQLNVNFTDGASHPFALYLVDWDGEYRSEIVKVSDTATGTVLDTENILSFTGGLYLSWNISGNVTVTVTATGGSQCSP